MVFLIATSPMAGQSELRFGDGSAAGPHGVCGGLRPGAESGSGACTYVHLAFGVFSFVGDRVAVDWGPDVEVLDAMLVADWQKVGAVKPNLAFAFRPDPTKARYDILVRLRRRSDGLEIQGMTPLWCAARPETVPAQAMGCAALDPDGSCSYTESTPCGDGSAAVVTCEGDGGTCAGGVDGGEVHCRATRTTIEWGATSAISVRTTLLTRTARCPTSAGAK